MASNDLTKLAVLIEANTRSYENAMKKIQKQTDDAMQGVSGSVAKTRKAFQVIEGGAGKAAKATKLTARELTQMQFQLQDIGVQLASGQSPFMTLIQQGSQIGQMFGPGSSVMGALKATGAGVITFLTNPINLAILGFASAAAIVPKVYEAIAGPEARSAADMLKTLNEHVDSLAAGYEDVAKSAREAMKVIESVDVLTVGFQRSENELKAGLAAAISDLTGMVSHLRVEMMSADDAMQFEGISRGQQEIVDLVSKLQSGNMTVAEFRDQIARIALADNAEPDVRDLANALLDATVEARGLEAALDGIGKATEQLQRTRKEQINDYLSGELRKQAKGMQSMEVKDTGDGSSLRDSFYSNIEKQQRKAAQAANKLARERERAAEKVKREQESVRSYITTLEQEIALVGASVLEKQKAANLNRLNASATDEQKARVEQLTETLYRNQQAWEAVDQATDFLADNAFDALMGIVDGTSSAEDALKGLVKQIARAALEATLLGKGPLAGLFGVTPQTSALGSLFGGLLGRAGGGNVSPTRPYVVGERGPEVFIPNTAGKVVANQNIVPANTGGGTVVNIKNYSGQEITQTKRQGPGGTEILDVMIGKSIGSGKQDKAMGGRYGMRAQPLGIG